MPEKEDETLFGWINQNIFRHWEVKEVDVFYAKVFITSFAVFELVYKTLVMIRMIVGWVEQDEWFFGYNWLIYTSMFYLSTSAINICTILAGSYARYGLYVPEIFFKTTLIFVAYCAILIKLMISMFFVVAGYFMQPKAFSLSCLFILACVVMFFGLEKVIDFYFVRLRAAFIYAKSSRNEARDIVYTTVRNEEAIENIYKK